MGLRFTKCGNCGVSVNIDTPIFKVYHAGRFGGKYLCQQCLKKKMHLIKDETIYTMNNDGTIMPMTKVKPRPPKKKNMLDDFSFDMPGGAVEIKL